MMTHFLEANSGQIYNERFHMFLSFCSQMPYTSIVVSVPGVDILVFSSSTDAKTPPVVRTLSFENSNPHKESRVTPPKAPCRAVDVKHITGDRNPSERVLGRASSTGSYMMEEMPCVSTKGEGPNGRRIEGFLYKYGKGEEVRIVCICHGSFWTPAEFVRHAGGGEVANPLKHIIVDPSALTFLG